MSGHAKEKHRLWLIQLVLFVLIFDILCLGCCAIFLYFNIKDIEGYEQIPGLTATDLASSSISFIVSLVIPLVNRRFVNDYCIDQKDTKNFKIVIGTIYLNLLLFSLVLLIAGSIFYLMELNFALIWILIVNLLLLILFVLLPGIVLVTLKEDYIWYVVKFSYYRHYYNSDLNNDKRNVKTKNKRNFFLSSKQVNRLMNQILIKNGFDDDTYSFFLKKSVCPSVVFKRLAKNQIIYVQDNFEIDIYDIKKNKIDSDRASISLLKNLFYIAENNDYLYSCFSEDSSYWLDELCKSICKLFDLGKGQNYYFELRNIAYPKIKNLMSLQNKNSEQYKNCVTEFFNTLAIISISKNDTWFISVLDEIFVGNNISGREYESNYCVFITFHCLSLIYFQDNSIKDKTRDELKETISAFSWFSFFKARFDKNDEKDLANLYRFLTSTFALHSNGVDWTPIMSKINISMFGETDFNINILFQDWFLFVLISINNNKKFSIKEFHRIMISFGSDAFYSQNIKEFLEYLNSNPEYNYYRQLIDLLREMNLISEQSSTNLEQNSKEIISKYLIELQ